MESVSSLPLLDGGGTAAPPLPERRLVSADASHGLRLVFSSRGYLWLPSRSHTLLLSRLPASLSLSLPPFLAPSPSTASCAGVPRISGGSGGGGAAALWVVCFCE